MYYNYFEDAIVSATTIHSSPRHTKLYYAKVPSGWLVGGELGTIQLVLLDAITTE